MTNDALQIKAKERLNRLDSLDYENIEPWQLLEAVNKAQLQWSRSMVSGFGGKGPVDEGSKQFIDDLEFLLEEHPLTTTPVEGLYESSPMPADYLGFKRIQADALTADCHGDCPPRRLRIEPCEAANVVDYLRDDNHRPSYDWAETFYTLQGAELRIYTDQLFTLSNPILTVYREPRPVTIPGVLDLTTGQLATTDQELEFSNPICELLLDKAVGILAGDTENTLQYQRATQEVALNS